MPKLPAINLIPQKIKPRLSGVASKDKLLSFEGEKVKFNTPKISFEMYDVPSTANDEGSYKYFLYLNEPPATNKIEFDIETSGLDFFYQPELTQQEIDDGCIRPPEIVGSYAVYHQTKGGMNDSAGKEYKVGKAFHIYRPHIIDAEGTETWGNLHIENGIYSVEIPQDFLDTAVYPIKSNDTFGYTTVGTYYSLVIAAEGSGTYNQSSTMGRAFNLSVDATLTKISAALKVTNTPDAGDITVAIYRE